MTIHESLVGEHHWAIHWLVIAVKYNWTYYGSVVGDRTTVLDTNTQKKILWILIKGKYISYTHAYTYMQGNIPLFGLSQINNHSNVIRMEISTRTIKHQSLSCSTFIGKNKITSQLTNTTIRSICRYSDDTTETAVPLLTKSNFTTRKHNPI